MDGGETKDRAALEGAVVDLLATWGATALPGMTDLFEVLAAFRQRGSLAVLRQLLDAPEIALDVGLRGELQDLLDASRAGAAPGAELEQSLPPLLEKATDALGEKAQSDREAIGQRLGPWAFVFGRDELHEILELLWLGERAEDVAGRLLAMRNLHQAGELIDRGIARVEQEKRSPSDRSSTAEDEKLQAARQRLAEICERARQTADESGPLLGANRRELLLAAAKTGRELLRKPAVAGDNGDSSVWKRSLARCERGLGVMLDDLSDAGEPARRKRAEAARSLIEQWRSLAAGLDQPTRAADRLERTLQDGVPSGGPIFYEALARGTESIRSLQQGRADHVKRAEARLRRAEKSLADELKRSAGSLPAGRLVQARLRVEGIGAVVAVGDPADLDSLAGAIEDETEAVRGLATSRRERRASAVTSERSGARENTEKLIGSVPPRTAARLTELLAGLERAKASEVASARRDLESVASQARNRIRLDAARTLHRAEKWLAGGNGTRASTAGANAETFEVKIQALRDALDKDDVTSLAARSRQVDAALKNLAPWSRPLVRVMAAAAGVLLIASLLVAWQWYSNRAREYRLSLVDTPALSESVTISLVRGGSIAEQGSYEPGGAAVVKLSPGEYEIYVNGRYTGRVIRVPVDPQDVTDIPVP
jgi:hypothetical protein